MMLVVLKKKRNGPSIKKKQQTLYGRWQCQKSLEQLVRVVFSSPSLSFECVRDIKKGARCF
jgi:hypothetical protein